jgi:hypothetical protein
MSPAHETHSMREIRLLRGRLPRKGGGLTGMESSLFLVSSSMAFNFILFFSSPFSTYILIYCKHVLILNIAENLLAGH